MTQLVNFPYQVERQGRTAVAGDEAHIRDLIEQLLFTLPGERVMRPTFGSGLAQLVFQPNSEEVATAVQFLVQGSLQQWLGELVTVEDVTVISVESTIDVQIQYVLRRTQERRVDQFSRPV
jgi:phage baseplate assembly protein W